MGARVSPKVCHSIGGGKMAVKTERKNLSVTRAQGEPKEPDVQSFDFVRPTRITNEKQILFKMVTHRMASSVERKLSSLTRVPAQVTVENTENMPFADFTDLLVNPCAAFVFRADASGAEGAVDMGTDCAFFLIDRLFGGSGESSQQGRPLSELEQSVVSGIAERVLEALRTGWSEHIELTPEITTFASSPEDLRTKDRGEALVTRLAVNIESHSSILSIALPMEALESFLQDDLCGGKHQYSDRIEAREYRSAIEGALKHARMSLSARLAPLSLAARTIADLSVGQVIQTKQHVEVPIEVHVNEHPRFVGTLGQVRRHVGVQLTEAVPGSPIEKPASTTRGRIL